MYINGPNIFFEKIGSTVRNGRQGHEITKGANPVMTTYPISSEMGIVEFPVFV